MYPNLRAEIARRKLKLADVAEGVGISETHFSLKMNGKYGFSLKEAFAIKQFLATDLSLDFLFQESLDEAV